MDLDEFRAFIAVVDNGSFKSASAALGQPRGTLRRRVDALESRAGVTLLERGRTGVATTAAGLRMLRHGRVMLREAGSLFRTLRSLEAHSKKVRIGLPLGFPPEGLLRMSSFIEKTLPRLRVELRFSVSPVDELLSDLDFALDFRPCPSSRQTLSTPLVEFRSGLVASESYLARHGTPRSLSELSQHRLISWVPTGDAGSHWPLLRGGSLPVDLSMSSHDFQLIRRLAARDAGIALLPDTNLPKLEPEDRTLVRVLPKEIGGKLRLYLHVNAHVAEHMEDFDQLTRHLHQFMSSMLPSSALLAKQALSPRAKSPVPKSYAKPPTAVSHAQL